LIATFYLPYYIAKHHLIRLVVNNNKHNNDSNKDHVKHCNNDQVNNCDGKQW